MSEQATAATPEQVIAPAPTAIPITGRLKKPPMADGTPEVPRIMIATPMYGGACTSLYMAGVTHLVRVLDASGIHAELEISWNESLITRARNRLVQRFLKSDCNRLFFIDADVGFSAADAKPLVESDLDVVCGCYPAKTIGWANVLEAAKAGKPAEELAASGARYVVNLPPVASNGGRVEGIQKAGQNFIQVQDAATGFLLIKRHIIEKFIATYRSAIEYVADYPPDEGQIHHMVFQADRDPEALARGQKARYLSEDYWFSRKLQQMGVPIWLCLGCRLNHTGAHTFTGRPSDLFIQDAAPAPAPEEKAAQ